MSHLTHLEQSKSQFLPRRLIHDAAFRNNNSGSKAVPAGNNQAANCNKVNNKIGDNETVEHTSPEMKKVCNLIKNSTPSSGDQLLKNSICNKDETVSPFKIISSKLSKQSNQNSISAFKPYGIIHESPAQHPQHAEVSQFPLSHHHMAHGHDDYNLSLRMQDSIQSCYQFSVAPNCGGSR